jgi:hypothetical protein
MTLSPTYIEKTSIEDELIISVSEMGTWLNLSASAIIVHTDLLTELIKSATELVEEYTWLSIRETVYEAYFDLDNIGLIFNGELGLSLERSPILDLDNITKIEYLNDGGTWTEFARGTKTIDGLYANTTEIKARNKWAELYFITDPDWDSRDYAYKLRVTFSAGWDVDEDDEALMIPRSLLIAIKQIVAFFYTNRGDCESECSINGVPVPCGAKMLLDKYRIGLTQLGG